MELVTDEMFSPAGDRVGCVGKTEGKWYVAVEDQIWDTGQDMAWQPVLSLESRKLLVRAVLPKSQGGHYCRILLDVDSPALSERRPEHA